MKNIRIFAAANAIGVWCSWLAFLHGVQAVARSSRATPTLKKSSREICCFFGYLSNVCKTPRQPSKTSRQVASKSPVYQGSATSPGRWV